MLLAYCGVLPTRLVTFAYFRAQGGVQYVVYNKILVAVCGPLTRKFGHVAVSPIKTFID